MLTAELSSVFWDLSKSTTSSASTVFGTPLRMTRGGRRRAFSALRDSTLPIFSMVAVHSASERNSTRTLLFETTLTLAGAKLVSLKETLDLHSESTSFPDVMSSDCDSMMTAGRLMGDLMGFGWFGLVDPFGVSAAAVRAASA